jgi:pyruvate dehydrogenase E1 component beta subunit
VSTQTARRERGARPDAGVNLAAALHDALETILEGDDRAMIMGEDVGSLGGVFRITSGLKARFGDDRVVDSPLAEAGLVGTAVGLALNGFRPLVEIQFDGFIYPALNQLLCHVATMPTRFEQPGLLPMVVRIPVGGRIRAGELHGESPETYFVHRAGFRVVSPSSAAVGGALLRAAAASDDAVIFLEPKRLYRGSTVDRADIVEEMALDKARLVREGDDAVVIAYGQTVDLAEAASDALRDEGINVAVLDLVSLQPLDVDAITEIASRTGRVVTVTEAVRRCSLASEVASLVAESCFADLKAAPTVVASEYRPHPTADFEDDFFPNQERLTAAIRKVLS